MQYENERRMDEEQRRRRQEQKRLEERRARRKRKRRLQIIFRLILLAVFLLTVFGVAALIRHILNTEETAAKESIQQLKPEKYIAQAPDFSVELLDINEYSRPGDPIDVVNGIVIHYTANPGTTAEQNRSYFQNLAETGETYASSHFVIGIEGEIIQCIPCNEIAYASKDRNIDTISIECCIPDETGKFTGDTYESLIRLVSWLMGRYGLSVEDVIRHYDVTGKECPKYYVRHEDAWELFKEDLTTYIDTYGIEKTEEIN